MSALNVLLKEPVIPFIRKIAEKDLRKVNLQHFVTVNITVGGVPQGHREKHSATVIKAETGDVEVLIRLITSFLEACNNDAPDLPDGMVHVNDDEHEHQLSIEDIRNIAAVRHPDISFDQIDLTTDEARFATNAISSQAITAEEASGRDQAS